jgi:hypothetical protein
MQVLCKRLAPSALATLGQAFSSNAIVLAFERRGSGYGFPVPKNARDMLVGDARTFEG